MEQHDPIHIEGDNVPDILSDEQNKRIEQIFDSYFSKRQKEKGFDEGAVINDFLFMVKNKKVPVGHAELQPVVNQLNDVIFAGVHKELANLSIVVHKDEKMSKLQNLGKLNESFKPIDYGVSSEVYLPEVEIVSRRSISQEKVDEINKLSIEYAQKRLRGGGTRLLYIRDIINNSTLSGEIKNFRTTWKNTYQKYYIDKYGTESMMLYDFFYTRGCYFSMDFGFGSSKSADRGGASLVRIKETKRIKLSECKIYNNLFGDKNIGDEILVHVLPGTGRNFCFGYHAYVDEDSNTAMDKSEESSTGVKIDPKVMETSIALHEGMHALLSKLYEYKKRPGDMDIGSAYIHGTYNYENIVEMLASVVRIRSQYKDGNSIQHFHMTLYEGINSTLAWACSTKEADINDAFLSKFRVTSFTGWTYVMTQEFAYNKFMSVLDVNDRKVFIKKIKEYRKMDLEKGDISAKEKEINLRAKDIIESKINKKALVDEYVQLGKILTKELEKKQ